MAVAWRLNLRRRQSLDGEHDEVDGVQNNNWIDEFYDDVWRCEA